MTEKTGDLKSGFILYFDNYPALASLTMEQRGLLLTALFTYGDRLRRGTEDTLEEVLDQFPQLDPGARVVALMMGANLARDHEKWLRRVETRRLAREQTAAQPPAGNRPAPPSAPARNHRPRAQGPRPDPNYCPAPDPISSYERTRQLLDRWKAEEESGEPRVESGDK